MGIFFRKKEPGSQDGDPGKVQSGQPVFTTSSSKSEVPASAVLRTATRSPVSSTSPEFRSRVDGALSPSIRPAYRKFLERFNALAMISNAGDRYKASLATTDGFKPKDVVDAVEEILKSLDSLERQLDVDVQKTLEDESANAEKEAQDIDTELKKIEAQIVELTQRRNQLAAQKSEQVSTLSNALATIRNNAAAMKGAFEEVRAEYTLQRDALAQHVS